MTPLKERWKAFGTTLCDPWIIILVICTYFLSTVLIRQSDVTIISTFTFLVSLSSGILGGIVTKRWDDQTEEKIIVARAKSANRSLQLLLSSAIALERRVRLYIQRYNNSSYKKKITSEVIKTYLEEIVEDSLSLEEKVINSIEDWKDILPDLDIKPVINLIRELNGNYASALAQLEQVNLSLQETKDKSEAGEANIKKLSEEKNEIRNKLLHIEKDLREQSSQFGVPSISGSLITGSSDTFLSSPSKIIGSALNLEYGIVDNILTPTTFFSTPKNVVTIAKPSVSKKNKK